MHTFKHTYMCNPKNVVLTRIMNFIQQFHRTCGHNTTQMNHEVFREALYCKERELLESDKPFTVRMWGTKHVLL